MANDPVGRIVQNTWVDQDVVQCGYCQTGQIMSAVALLKNIRKPTDKDIEESMAGNLCRCGTYVRVRLLASLSVIGLRKGSGDGLLLAAE
jgi:isoquinoline 1-oxidoreductase subunit alpha